MKKSNEEPKWKKLYLKLSILCPFLMSMFEIERLKDNKHLTLHCFRFFKKNEFIIN